MIARLLAPLGLGYCWICGWWTRPTCGHTT